MTEINHHMRRRGTFVNLDDVTLELVARTKLHYFLLQSRHSSRIAIRDVNSISATLFPLCRCDFNASSPQPFHPFSRPFASVLRSKSRRNVCSSLNLWLSLLRPLRRADRHVASRHADSDLEKSEMDDRIYY
jgi:hypothetical protein